MIRIRITAVKRVSHMLLLFFFSSRRRHTRLQGDWSSDVCSSDLLVILDRDGTINYDSDEYIKSPAEWRTIEGSLEAIARLTQAGYRVVVATNQSGDRKSVV